MSKREQITQIIETYIKDYCPKDKHTLTVGEIRKWPAVDRLCENTDYANICSAMDKISIKHEIKNPARDTTTHEISF